MRNNFVVHLENTMVDQVELSNGVSLYIDTKYDEFKHRVNEGEVAYIPYNYNTEIETGDTIYFHHLVVLNGGQKLPGHDNHYVVFYNPDTVINSQVIAYRKKGSNSVIPMSGWSILKHVDEPEKELKSSVIELVKLKEDNTPSKGAIAFDSEDIKTLELNVGDVVGFAKNMDYRFKIDGDEYYRVRTEDLLYVEEA